MKWESFEATECNGGERGPSVVVSIKQKPYQHFLVRLLRSRPPLQPGEWNNFIK